MSRHTFATEYDGSLVVDNIIVASPSSEFPSSAMRQIADTEVQRSELLAALIELANRANTPAFKQTCYNAARGEKNQAALTKAFNLIRECGGGQ